MLRTTSVFESPSLFESFLRLLFLFLFLLLSSLEEQQLSSLLEFEEVRVLRFILLRLRGQCAGDNKRIHFTKNRGHS